VARIELKAYPIRATTLGNMRCMCVRSAAVWGAELNGGHWCGPEISDGFDLEKSVLFPHPFGNALMPRYYFDLTDDKVIHDLKGKNLPNLREARQHAIAMARELMRTKSTLLREPLSAWSISVKDGRFNKVLSVRVSSCKN
jgi:hypothetical protein